MLDTSGSLAAISEANQRSRHRFRHGEHLRLVWITKPSQLLEEPRIIAVVGQRPGKVIGNVVLWLDRGMAVVIGDG